MPRFWTRLVDSLPRDSKNLTWRVPLVLGTVLLSVLIFFPYRDTPYRIRVVKDTYKRKRIDPDARQHLPYGSYLGPSDVLDWAAFAGTVKEAAGSEDWSAAKRIAGLLPPELRGKLQALGEGKAPGQELRKDILGVLNGALKKPGFHTEQAFRGVAVPDEAAALLARDDKDRSELETQRMNRLLLEAAYPKLVAESPVSRMTSWWVWLTSFFHYEVERELLAKDLPPEGGRRVQERTLEVRSRGLNLGLDLRGGSELLYRIQIDDETKKSVTAQEIKGVIQRRIDASGLTEPRIQVQGTDRLLIQLPGQEAEQLEQIKSVIQNIGHLEFRLVAEGGPVETWTRTRKAPAGYHEYELLSLKEGQEDFSRERILIGDRAEMTGKYISGTYVSTAGTSLRPTIVLRFTALGEQKFGSVTQANIKRRLAIVLNTVRKGDGTLTKPGRCYSAPEIRGAIFGNAEISGSFDLAEARNLRTVLMAGSLPAPLQLESENTVGASLGPALIGKGVRAIVIGLLGVLVFMAAYYWLAGGIANFALFLNILIIVSIMILFGATLTLPGIAGLLLTVGMSVDANVLIFERIREERSGPTDKLLRLAIRDGYDRAFWTIFDANLTTLFTALILNWLGTGAIKGFAIVLIVGILTSMFTALVVTRVVFDVLTWRRWLRRLPMLQLIRSPQIAFMRLRNRFLAASVVLVVGGMTLFGMRGENNWDIDFRGGQLIHLVFQRPMDADDVARRLRDAGPQFADVEVQPIVAAAEEGGAFLAGRTAREFTIRFPTLSDVVVPPITPRAITSPGTATATFTLHEPRTKEALDKALQEAKLFDYTLTPVTEGEAPADAKHATWSASAPLVDLDKIEKELTEALATLRPAGKNTAFATFERGAVTYNYRMHVEKVTIGRTVPLDAIAQALEADGGHWKVVGTSTEAPPGHFTEFTIDSGLENRILCRSRIEDAFAAHSVAAEVLAVFEADLAPEGIEHLSATLAVNLTRPVPPTTLAAKLKDWGLAEAKVTPEKVGEDGAERFVLTLPGGRRVDDLAKHVTDDSETFPLSEPIDAEAATVTVAMNLTRPVPPATLAARLKDWGLAEAKVTPERVGERGAARFVLALPKGRVEELTKRITADTETFPLSDPMPRVAKVGPAVAMQMLVWAVLAIAAASVIIIAYVWLRFERFKYGIAAVAALLHDVLITIGLLALFGRQVNMPIVAALLTIIGYSINDTIVVFDRMRENLRKARKRDVDADIIDASINQVLSRTVITSLTTLFAVLSLFLFAGGVIQDFALTLLIGVVVGTYSSIFIASPILILHQEKIEKRRRR